MTKRDSGKSVTCYCSFLQIYNERVYDLLNFSDKKAATNAAAGLRIRWNKTDQFVVENLFVFEVKTPEEVLEKFNQGIKSKIVASHNLNQNSSRSHAIFSISLETLDPHNLVILIFDN
jgi:hypothetical protein